MRGHKTSASDDFGWLDQILQDVRYGLRTWRANPVVASAIVLTLGLGVGAATAISSLVEAILVRPLPFGSSDRLVRIIENVPLDGPEARTYQRGFTLQEFSDWRARTRTLSDAQALSTSIALVATADGTMRLWGSSASPGIFTLLGTRAMLGRTLQAGDETQTDVVVLSYETWRRLFHSATDIVGKRVEFLSANAPRRLTIVGVLPADFDLPIGEGDFYTPFGGDRSSTQFLRITMVGKIAEGVTLGGAQQEAAEIGAAVTKPPSAASATMPVPRFEVRRLKDLEVQPLRPAFRVLLAAVIVLVLVVCANVANLLLVRGTARQREISVRFALGASRSRIVRQLLTECVMLALAGGTLGAAIAAIGLTAVKQLSSVDAPGIFRLSLGASILPRLHEVRADPTTFAIAFGVSALAAMMFGILPALYLSRPGPLQSAFQAASVRGGGNSRAVATIRAALVIGPVALATVLLVGAGLLIQSFSRLTNVDRGFASENVLAFQVVFPPAYSIARKVETVESILTRLRSQPEVAAAGFTRHGVFIGERITIGTFVPPGRTVDEMRKLPVKPSLRPVSGGYLTAVGAHLIEGTDLNSADAGPTPPIVISRSAAAQFGPGRQIGKFVDWYVGDRIVQLQVVGVVNDLRNTSPEREPFPEVFVDYRQVLEIQQAQGQSPLFQNERALGLLSFAVRTRGDAASAAPAVSQVVREVDQNAGIDAIVPIDRLVASSLVRPRFYAVLLAGFASVAGLLAAVGIYGVLAYAVVQRTREIGVRIALGARHKHILALIVRQGLLLTALGLGLGLTIAAASAPVLQALLFQITPLDRRTFVLVALAFGVAAALACYVPARRATSVQPIVALRSE